MGGYCDDQEFKALRNRGKEKMQIEIFFYNPPGKSQLVIGRLEGSRTGTTGSTP